MDFYDLTLYENNCFYVMEKVRIFILLQCRKSYMKVIMDFVED